METRREDATFRTKARTRKDVITAPRASTASSGVSGVSCVSSDVSGINGVNGVNGVSGVNGFNGFNAGVTRTLGASGFIDSLRQRLQGLQPKSCALCGRRWAVLGALTQTLNIEAFNEPPLPHKKNMSWTSWQEMSIRSCVAAFLFCCCRGSGGSALGL